MALKFITYSNVEGNESRVKILDEHLNQEPDW